MRRRTLAAAVEQLGLGDAAAGARRGRRRGRAQRAVALECAACTDGLVAAADATGAAIVDGGTDAGVMRLLGRAHARAGANVPLVGVIVRALAALPGEPRRDDGAPPEPNHTHIVLVPGASWGDEAPWIARLAGAIAGDRPSVTVLVNGGEIALDRRRRERRGGPAGARRGRHRAAPPTRSRSGARQAGDERADDARRHGPCGGRRAGRRCGPRRSRKGWRQILGAERPADGS